MPQSIFERYGGFSSIRRVVSDFYDNVLDSDLAHYFADVEMRRLIEHQTSFISFLTGGPGTNYADAMLQHVHEQLAITPEDFDLMMRVLRRSLTKHGFETEDVDVVLERFAGRRALIVADAPVA